MQWTLCSMKEGTGKESHVNLDSHNITDKNGIESHASFEVDIPTSVDFERQMEFQVNLQPSDLVSICSWLKINSMENSLNFISNSI